MGTIDDQIKDAREQRSRAHRTNTDPNAADISDNKGGIQFGTSVAYDDAYHADSGDFVSELPTLDEERRMMGDDDDGARRRAEMEDSGRIGSHPSTLAGMKGKAGEDEESEHHDPFKHADGGSGLVNTRISDRESDYHKRRLNRAVREEGMTYKDAMTLANIEKEKSDLINEAKKEILDENGKVKSVPQPDAGIAKPRRRRRRWDDANNDGNDNAQTGTAIAQSETLAIVSDNESIASKIHKSRWDEDVGTTATNRRKRWDETPVASSTAVDATPLFGASNSAPDATPLVTSSKWDETPLVGSHDSLATPMVGDAVASSRKRSRWDLTPAPSSAASNIAATPSIGSIQPVPGDLVKALTLEKEMATRNRPWTEAALDAILPSEGYSVLPPPTTYQPLRTPGRKLLATPTPLGMTPAGFQMAIPPEELQAEGASVNDIRATFRAWLGLFFLR